VCILKNTDILQITSTDSLGPKYKIVATTLDKMTYKFAEKTSDSLEHPELIATNC